MLAVEKYTSRLFQRSHKIRPKSQRPDNSTDALKVIAHRATVENFFRTIKARKSFVHLIKKLQHVK